MPTSVRLPDVSDLFPDQSLPAGHIQPETGPAAAATYKAGGTEEVFLTLASTPAATFAEEVSSLFEKYESLLQENRCSVNTEVLLRFHLSDVTTQAPAVETRLSERNAFVTYIGQPPVHGARIGLEAYHIRSAKGLQKKRLESQAAHELDVLLENYELLFHCRRNLTPGDSFAQTEEECCTLNAALRKRNGSLADNCVRTWFYVRDIDNNYQGVVDARREAFADLGMTEKTHYIASTGIEGQCQDPHRLVGVDSLNLFGIVPAQVNHMQALDHMSHTYAYNVTFERGTRILFGDRSHYYVSGTASIDKLGEILHVGDVKTQTVRMIENVQALLENHGARLADLKTATVYLRDGADATLVEATLASLLPPTIPRLLLRAPVCRPGWLIEIEGIAINNKGDSSFPDFA